MNSTIGTVDICSIILYLRSHANKEIDREPVLTFTKTQKKPKQLAFLKTSTKAYGGELLKTRKGRSHGRPLDTRNTMHLVLRSSKAKGKWSFLLPGNKKRIKEIVDKFAHKYGIQVFSMANVGNHLHLHIKLSNRYGYKPFIRAITSAIAMAVTGKSRWTKMNASFLNSKSSLKTKFSAKTSSANSKETSTDRLKFWDLRPFTRVIHGFKAFLSLKDYILLNEFEGFGVRREQAKMIIRHQGQRWARSFLRTAPSG